MVVQKMSHIATIATIIAIKLVILPHSYYILLMMLLLILFVMDTVVVMVFGQVVLFVSMSVSMQLNNLIEKHPLGCHNVIVKVTIPEVCHEYVYLRRFP